MKPKTYITEGKIDAKGQLLIDRPRLTEFLKNWPGHVVNVNVEVYDKEASQRQRARYWGYVVPMFREALKQEQGEYLTIEDTDVWIRRMSVSCIRERVTGEGAKGKVIKQVGELDSHELSDFLNEIEILGATELGIIWE